MFKIKHLIIALSISLSGLLLASAPQAASAVSPLTFTAKSWSQCTSNFLGFPPWYRYIPMTADCAPKITKISQVWVIALNIIDMMIRAAGIIAVAFIMWGGFKYIKSQGEPSALADAKTVILNSVIGLVMVIASVAIVQYVAGSIG